MILRTNKNFKSIFSIGIFTNIGDSIFFIVTMWYIANHSTSSFYVGLVVFLFTLPETLLLFFGPFIDNFNPKKILTVSTLIQIIVHLVLILLFTFNLVNIPLLLILLLLSATASSITYPVEETVIPQIVENHEIVKANSLFSIAYKMTNSLFDGLAGILLAISTVSMIYGINLFIFLVPLLLIRSLKLTLTVQHKKSFKLANYKQDLKAGLHFVLKSKIRLMVLPLAFLNFFTAINMVSLPFFANSLSTSPATYGLLLSFSGAGSMIGALLINKIEEKSLPGKILTFGLFFNGVMWFLTIISPTPYLAYFFIFLANLCMGGYNIIFSSLFQLMTPPQLLGRINTSVNSIITIAMPIGSLLGGVLIAVLPLKVVMSFNAFALGITAIIYFLNKSIYQLEHFDKIKPIEIKKTFKS
ncbi:MFS transporter [Carnobacterium gallinarum]|uniref:MFS transporter n=1 Tax=Carnobacterium gallinarum TaxID=2749 RepID=UPI000558DD84|nr:MFS transporter [Carnobacterium gallinarum]